MSKLEGQLATGCGVLAILAATGYGAVKSEESKGAPAVALQTADALLAQIGMNCQLALQDPIGPRSFTPAPDSDGMCARLRLRIDTTSADKDQIACLEDEVSALGFSLPKWTFSDGDVQLTIPVAQDDTCHIIWRSTPLGYEPKKSE